MAHARQNTGFIGTIWDFGNQRINRLRSETVAPFLAEHSADFIDDAPGRLSQIIIALGDGAAHTEDQRLGFGGIKGERR